MSIYEEKVNYLKSIYDEENERQSTIEGKCAQNISNSGIFLTLLGVLITIISNAQTVLPNWVKLLLVTFIVGITVANIISIVYASQGLDPLRYRYARGDASTVDNFTEVENFHIEIIKDYKTCIATNSNLNNNKATCLIKSRNAYVWGIYLTGLFTFFLVCYISFFVTSAPDKIQKIEIVSTAKNNCTQYGRTSNKTTDCQTIKPRR